MPKKPYDRHLGIRFDNETHYKLKYVAEYEGRSVSAHILYVLRQNIKAFEEEHGKIEYPPKEE